MTSAIAFFIYLVFIIYAVMALFISLRDIVTTKNKILWIPIFAIIAGVILLLFVTTIVPAAVLPLTLLISVPIFVTDKRRDWDWVDRVFRWVSLLAIICAAFIFINYFFLR